MKPKHIMERDAEINYLRKEVGYLKLVDEYNTLNKKVFDENILIVRSVSNAIETIGKEFKYDVDTIKKCYELMNIPMPNIERNTPVSDVKDDVIEVEAEILQDDSLPPLPENDMEKVG